MTPPDPLVVIDDVRRACLAVDGHDPIDESVHLRLKHHGLTGSASWVEEGGFALRHQHALDLAVAPERRGHGLGERLAASATAEGGELAAWSRGDHPAARKIAERLGFARARELWVMRRPTAVPLPKDDVPPGVTIRDFGGTADAEGLLAVNAAAFAAHPEQGSMSAEDLAERMAEPWFDPAGLLLATEGDRVLGFHWTKQHSPDLGEVYVVGIDPAAQGGGLGRTLTLAGLHHLARTGARRVHLYVESDNAPALRIYSGLGFEHADSDTHTQYHRLIT